MDGKIHEIIIRHIAEAKKKVNSTSGLDKIAAREAMLALMELRVELLEKKLIEFLPG